jgi:taurine dioxygenase
VLYFQNKGANVMSQVEITEEQDRYNQVAIKYADKIQQARSASKPTSQPAVDDLFPSFNRVGLGAFREYERMGNQPVTDGLQARADQQGVKLEHLGLTVGTVLHNIDLKQTLSAKTVQLIRDTLLERKVVFFRDQNLTEDEQVSFGRYFGDLDAFPFGKSGDNPYILEIIHNEKQPGTENGWHTDVTWMEKPSLGSIAQCVVVPPFGGDTLFADSYAAYQGLPVELQERLQHISGINDYQIFLMGRGTGALPDDITEGLKKEVPFGVSHPILRTHPETGKTALYFNGGFLRHESLYDNRTDEALDVNESKEIVSFLQQQHGRPEYVCRFKWEPGSIAFWDNRAVQHYAASDYYPHNRLLRRVTVSGDRPYYNPVNK